MINECDYFLCDDDLLFSEIKPEQFKKIQHLHTITHIINTTLTTMGRGHTISEYQFWDVIDDCIKLDESDIYSYTSELDSDPFEGSL
jgi:hypothetical protein